MNPKKVDSLDVFSGEHDEHLWSTSTPSPCIDWIARVSQRRCVVFQGSTDRVPGAGLRTTTAHHAPHTRHIIRGHHLANYDSPSSYQNTARDVKLEDFVLWYGLFRGHGLDEMLDRLEAGFGSVQNLKPWSVPLPFLRSRE